MELQSLVGSIKICVHPEHIKRLTIIDTEDYTGVAHKTEELFRSQGIMVTKST